jgi:hypothetical protein
MSNLAYQTPEDPRTSAALVEPEVITPSQFFNSPGQNIELQPEKRLVLSILEAAVSDFQRYATARDAIGTGLFDEAEAWFASTDRVWPFSFENACQWLGLEPDPLRRGLATWKAGQLAGDRRPITTSPFRRVVGSRHKTTGRAAGLAHLRVAR